MKILMLITGMTSGGAERVMATLCNEISKDNEIILGIFKEAKTDYEISERVKIFSGNIQNKSLIKSVKFVSNLISQEKPDIVLSFMTKTNIISLLSKKINRFNCPFIISERANPYNTKGILKILRKKLYAYADGCVFQTKWAQEYYKDIIKCESRIIVNPLSSDFNIGPYEGKRATKIVCTARLSKEKNQQFLIKVFSKIKDTYPDYTLEIYGEGPTKKKLEQLINRLKLTNKVKLMGRRKNIIECIQDAKLFVLPSNSEGMPNALLESMALGIPSISTDCPIGGPADIILNNENGILVKMNDEIALVEAISKILNDESFATKLSKNATQVVQRFETQKICHEWQEYIKEIIMKYGDKYEKN